jgi:predicted O-methyltransferase YrrM
MVSGMRPGATAVSIERDPVRADAAAALFSGLAPEVAVECAEWPAIAAHGPFDLLVLDGGGQGKSPADPPADPVALLRPGGVLVVDDFTPSAGAPPVHEGAPDTARLHWLDHPALRTIEVPLAPDLATLLCTRRA